MKMTPPSNRRMDGIATPGSHRIRSVRRAFAIAALTTMPIPPFVKMLKGLSIVLKDAKIDMSKGPEGIESAIGYALISATAPEQLLATAKAMVPPLASLTVPSDSTCA